MAACVVSTACLVAKTKKSLQSLPPHGNEKTNRRCVWRWVRPDGIERVQIGGGQIFRCRRTARVLAFKPSTDVTSLWIPIGQLVENPFGHKEQPALKGMRATSNAARASMNACNGEEREAK